MTRNHEVLAAARRYVGEVGALEALRNAAQQRTAFWQAVREVCEAGFRRADAVARIYGGAR